MSTPRGAALALFLFVAASGAAAEAQQSPPWPAPSPLARAPSYAPVLPPPPGAGPHTLTPRRRDALPRRPAREPLWYGDEAWAVSGVSLLLSPLFGVGILGLLFGGPTVHWAHGHVGRGFAALGMNVGATVAGLGLGVAGACAAGSCHGELGAAFLGVGGAAFGLILANIINNAALCYEDPPGPAAHGSAPRPTLAPRLDLAIDRAMLGVAGTF